MPFLGWPEMALVVLVLLLIFGPERMPQMAKALGQAIREFRKASESPFYEAPTPPKPTQEKALMDTAKKLGITTEGKTTEQVAEEIVKKAGEVSKGVPSQPAPVAEAAEKKGPIKKKEPVAKTKTKKS